MKVSIRPRHDNDAMNKRWHEQVWFAERLYELRNHMEHKFMSVHDMLPRVISPLIVVTPKVDPFDILASDLIAKTLRQLKLACAAIIYLSLAAHVEERRVKTKGQTANSACR